MGHQLSDRTEGKTVLPSESLHSNREAIRQAMTSLTTQSQWPAIAATGVTGAPVQSEPGVASKTFPGTRLGTGVSRGREAKSRSRRRGKWVIKRGPQGEMLPRNLTLRT